MKSTDISKKHVASIFKVENKPRRRPASNSSNQSPDYVTFIKKYSGALVHQRTILTEEPPLVGEVSANFSG
jgi:hypothetical protein